ncbi:MAG: alpha/beta fold hydrolase [Oligoflexales bacterium]
MHKESKFISHDDGTKIHVVQTILDPKKVTTLLLPGLSGDATESFNSLSKLVGEGFNLMAMSFRGRGRSSTPSSGYSIRSHAQDLDLVINTIQSDKVVLVATSIASIYTMEYLEQYRTQRISGLVIVDHPLKVRKLKSGWAQNFSKLKINGVSVCSTMRKCALEAVEQESTDEDYYRFFKGIDLPTLLMYPTIPNGVITEEDLQLFKDMKHVELAEVSDSDHFIRLRQPQRYYEVVDGFLERYS